MPDGNSIIAQGLTPEQLLKKRFGFDQFRPGQREVIDHLLAGRSAVAVFPTGSGKSICYQLTALTLPGVTLVVSPLIALMKDQIDALAQRGIAARRLDSTLTHDAYREVMHQVREGALRLLYVAPERFNNERFRETILQTRISLFAIDEAHCISEWVKALSTCRMKHLAAWTKEHLKPGVHVDRREELVVNPKEIRLRNSLAQAIPNF